MTIDKEEKDIQALWILAHANSAVFAGPLAAKLSERSIRQWQAGLHAEALASSEGAVSLLRELRESSPQDHVATFGAALINLGNCYFGMNRNEEALAVTTEAVSLLRNAPPGELYDLLPSFAMGLSNMGTILANQKQWEKSIDPTIEAVSLYRSLAKSDPATHRPSRAHLLP